jgi:hypothetical protein
LIFRQQQKIWDLSTERSNFKSIGEKKGFLDGLLNGLIRRFVVGHWQMVFCGLLRNRSCYMWGGMHGISAHMCTKGAAEQEHAQQERMFLLFFSIQVSN